MQLPGLQFTRARVFLALFIGLGVNAPAEITFQDFFSQAAGNITNSQPWIDVQGTGWQYGSNPSLLALDGVGHVYNSAPSAGTFAGVRLVPIGPHGSMTISTLMQLPPASLEFIGLGFASSNTFLTSPASGSGPWLQTQGDGTMILYGGAGVSNALRISGAFTNSGVPVRVFLTYDAFHATATAGTISGGVTNLVFNQWPVTNSAGSVLPNYLVLQMSTNLTSATARWASSLSVDWYPRPQPMLTLPVPIVRTNLVGSPGTNDILLTQNALNGLTSLTGGSELRFSAGATYVLTNSSSGNLIPLILQQATNVLVNGNACKILVTNPRLGFLGINNCSNVIVQGFSVDYDPLPFTQGIVTHNFFTNTPKELAIEFLVDSGYPAPTNANYVDAYALTNGRLWGTVMDPTHPGRGADGSYSACLYTNVIQTNSNGAFKVFFSFGAQAKSIQPGSYWHMISRWNGSPVFNAFQSWQVTFLNNTNYAGAGISYSGRYSPLVSEVGDQIQLGPPPPGATAPRLRTSNADGGYFVDSRIGPWVEGCNFTGLSDDTANPNLSPFIITNVPVQPTNTFALYQNSEATTAPTTLLGFEARLGDDVMFFNPINGLVFDRATITSVSLPNVTFDHAISNIVAGTYDTNTLVLDRSLNTSAVYLNNQFSNSRQHGIYARADNLLIAHNLISGMNMGGICAFPAMTPTFLNLFVPTNVIIMDNVLADCSFSKDSLSNSIPDQEPAFALIDFHNASVSSDYVTNGYQASGIRILYNALLDWRRAPISLHNATDVNVIGNYFGPPITSDGLVPLTNDVLADLWASDYPNLRFNKNVNATAIPDAQTINEDGTTTSIPGAFQLPAPPRLSAARTSTNITVSWISPSPGFILQEAGRLSNGSNYWVDASLGPWLAGQSNIVTIPLAIGTTNQFYRAHLRQ